MSRHANFFWVRWTDDERIRAEWKGACIGNSCRGSGACMSAPWLCEHRHNYCVYKAGLLLLLNYWGGGALKEEEQRQGGGGSKYLCLSLIVLVNQAEECSSRLIITDFGVVSPLENTWLLRPATGGLSEDTVWPRSDTLLLVTAALRRHVCLIAPCHEVTLRSVTQTRHARPSCELCAPGCPFFYFGLRRVWDPWERLLKTDPQSLYFRTKENHVFLPRTLQTGRAQQIPCFPSLWPGH